MSPSRPFILRPVATSLIMAGLLLAGAVAYRQLPVSALPLSAVEDLADTRLALRLSQLAGVGLVSISGGQKPAVRIQANPTLLASYGLTLEGIRTAVSASSVNQAKGTFDGPHQAYTIGANDQLLSSAQYRPVIVAYRNGAPVRCPTSRRSRTRSKTCARPPG